MTNSGLPAYTVIYGDVLSDVAQGIFGNKIPNAIPIVKQLVMKAIDVVHDAIGYVAGKAFSAFKDRLEGLISRKPQPVKITSAEAMLTNVRKVINQTEFHKQAEQVYLLIGYQELVFVLDDNIYNNIFKRVSAPTFDMNVPVLQDESMFDYQYYSYDVRGPGAGGIL